MGTGSDTPGCSLTQAARSSNLEPAGVADERGDGPAVAVQRRAPLRFAEGRAAGVAKAGRALRHDDQIADLALVRDACLQDGLARRALFACGVRVVLLGRVVQ